MIEHNYVQMNRFFQDWKGFSKIWKDFSQFSYVISFSQHLLTKCIVSKISWYFLIWGTTLKLYVGMSGPSFETSMNHHCDTHTRTHAEDPYIQDNQRPIHASGILLTHKRAHTSTHTQYVGIYGYQDEIKLIYTLTFFYPRAKFITSLHSDVIDFLKVYYNYLQ